MSANIFITGASSGIGYACAKFFIHRDGATVIGSVRSKESGDKIKDELGPNFHYVLFDVRNEEQIKKAYSKVENICNGSIDLLINNAGISVPGPLKDLHAADFEKQININLHGVFRTTNTFLPLLGGSLPKSQKPGKIINVSSVSGLFNSPFLGAYCISKHALESMNEVYRRELSIYGIKVISIIPGPIKTDIWQKALDHKDDFHTSDYSPILSGMERRIQKSEKNAMPVESVAEIVHRIHHSKNPKRRYFVTENNFKSRFFHFVVPNGIKERMVIKFIQKRMAIQ